MTVMAALANTSLLKVLRNNLTIIKYVENTSESFNEHFSDESKRSNLSNITGIRTESVFESKLMIPLYLIIFVLSVVGNMLVLFTLVNNKRMRTVTNVYLLNLAVADLLLGVLCMPFTLVGQVLRNFIFGATMCKVIPYSQAVSISVAVWTLVAISLERYFAICRPLKSRRWQTRFHASKMIAFVWIASMFWSGPILVVSTLQATKRGYKCREVWPTNSSEQVFNLFLDIILLLVPLTIMSLAYFMIMEKLWRGLQREIEHNSCQKLLIQKSCSSPNVRDPRQKGKNMYIYSENDADCIQEHEIENGLQRYPVRGSPNSKLWVFKGFAPVHVQTPTLKHDTCSIIDETRSQENYILKETTYTFPRHGIRSNFTDRSIEAKRKVIRMLFVIVAEFFICWAPLHILNTWYLFYPKEVYAYVGSTGVSMVQLLAYISSCSNPITYCFMNRRFRQSFFTAFRCRRLCENHTSATNNEAKLRNIVLKKAGNQSENSGNDSTLYVGKISSTRRSDPEAEERV